MDSREHHPMMGSFSYGGQGQGALPPVTNPSAPGAVPGGVHLSFGPVAPPPPAPKPPGDAHTQGGGGGPVAYNGDGMQGVRPSPVGGGGYGGGAVGGGGEPVKKKRGRPRKYGPDGNLTAAFSVSGYAVDSQQQQTPASEPSAKRRGRPPGSGKKQQLEALGPSGSDFVPHVITVNPGENVASKIMAFSQQGPRTICILSASGVVSNVALRQPATCGGTVTYEGRFEILSLSGSYMLTENGDTRSRSGGLSVALGGSDGRVLGGGVAGVLTAATPVQVIVGSFLAEGKKPKPNPPTASDPSSVPPPPPMASFGGPQARSPQSQGSASDSSEKDDNDDDGDGSPFNQHNGGYNDSGQRHILNAPPYTMLGWSHPLNQPRQ